MFTEEQIDEAGQQYNWDVETLYWESLAALSDNDKQRSDLLAAACWRARQLEEFKEWFEGKQKA